jgi:BTB/POZ domain-containing protein KCTD9
LIIIKSTNDNVFGGYTEQTWNHTSGYKADPNSFIFSLINKLNKPIKIKCSQGNSIYCSSDYGPSFGMNDLHIFDKSNININSFSNLGHSYTHPDFVYGSNEARSFLAGSYNYQVSEIEVYTKE